MAVDATPGAPAPRPVISPRAKPDPRPLRLLWGALALAGLAALTPALLVPPVVTTMTGAGALANGGPGVRYVQLQPGQTAPPGALVLTQPTPSSAPRLVTLPAPTPRVVVIRTTQSGTVLP